MLNLPIIINNYNRLTSTKKMVEFLLDRGNTNVIIIDNDSTYKPLLEWYSVCKVQVILLKQNFGHLAIWNPRFDSWIKNKGMPYFYTDSDIELNENLPLNWQQIMFDLLKQYNKKIAFSIRIDDIPDFYPLKEKAVDNELRWWKDKIEHPELELYEADTDTTFALYPSNSRHSYQSIRIAGDFTCKHLPWYLDINNLNEEELFYLKEIKTHTQFSQLLREKIK